MLVTLNLSGVPIVGLYSTYSRRALFNGSLGEHASWFMSKEPLPSSFSHLALVCLGLIDAPAIQRRGIDRTLDLSLSAPIRSLQSSACEWCESAGSNRGSSPPAAGMDGIEAAATIGKSCT